MKATKPAGGVPRLEDYARREKLSRIISDIDRAIGIPEVSMPYRIGCIAGLIALAIPMLLFIGYGVNSNLFKVIMYTFIGWILFAFLIHIVVVIVFSSRYRKGMEVIARIVYWLEHIKPEEKEREDIEYS
jgi:hypothetical protein